MTPTLMCDYREGELILAHLDSDPFGAALVENINSGAVEHVTVMDDMRRRLYHAETEFKLPLRVYLLRVPEGQEIWKINYLHYYYQTLISQRPSVPVAPMIVPNSYLTLEGFTASSDHTNYKNMLGWSHGATGAGVTVAVVDSGIEAGTTVPVAKFNDLLGTGADRVGHGTAVANVIHDVAPNADVHIIKVIDSSGLVEWDALAGLATAARADVINVSMSFGSATRFCSRCGRQSISSRSIVFESMVGVVLEQPHEPLIVAAAGNQASGQLRYPARFGDIVAVGALDSSGNRASYSNYGAVDAAGNAHVNLFFAPGGERARPVGTTTAPLPSAGHFGTSLATAYATGVIACARERRGAARGRLLADLRAAAMSLPNPQPADDGNGLIQGC